MSTFTNNKSKRGEKSDNAPNNANFGELLPRAGRSSIQEEAKTVNGGAHSPVTAIVSTSANMRPGRLVSHAKRRMRETKSTSRSRSPTSSKKNEDSRILRSDSSVSDSSNEEIEKERDNVRERKRKRGKGRPAKSPEKEGKFTAVAFKEQKRLEKMQKQEEDEDRAFDPTVALRFGAKLAKARKEESRMLLEFKETSSAGLSAIVTEQVAMLRRVAQNSSNLKGTSIKALWDASTSISAAAFALNLRAQSSGQVVTTSEWEDLREEVRQLRGDLSHLRTENDSLRAELKKEKEEREKIGKRMEEEGREKNEKKKQNKEIDPDPNLSSTQETTSSQVGRPKRRTVTYRRRIVDSSEDESDMEVGEENNANHRCPQSVPDIAGRLLPGEITPPAYRPSLKGVCEEIEPERQYKGPKALTMNDLNAALEIILPQLIGRLGLTSTTKGRMEMSPPGPNHGSVPSKTRGHTSTWTREKEHPPTPQTSSTVAGAGHNQPPATAPTDNVGNKKKKKKGGKKKAGTAAANISSITPSAPAASSYLVTQDNDSVSTNGEERNKDQEQWSHVVGKRQKKKNEEQPATTQSGKSCQTQALKNGPSPTAPQQDSQRPKLN